MARNYSLPTIKQLFAEALTCAHPECNEPLVFQERGRATVVADIAHIRSEKINGPRYDAAFTGDLNGPDNLLLLCGKHHRPVDRHEAAYTIDELLLWKEAQRAAAGAGTPISDDEAKTFTALSDEERGALSQVARLAERVVVRASDARDALNRIDAERRRAVESFANTHPMWEVDDATGERRRIGAEQISLSRNDEEHFLQAASEVESAQRPVIRDSILALREELAVLRMIGGASLTSACDAVALAAEGVELHVGNEVVLEQSVEALNASVTTLWLSATGQEAR